MPSKVCWEPDTRPEVVATSRACPPGARRTRGRRLHRIMGMQEEWRSKRGHIVSQGAGLGSTQVIGYVYRVMGNITQLQTTFNRLMNRLIEVQCKKI